MLEDKLKRMGYVLPVFDDSTTGKIERGLVDGDLLFISGQVPKDADGKITHRGKLGSDLQVSEGYEAARYCALNCLAVAKLFTKSLEGIVRIMRVRGFVNSSPHFTRQAEVVNGASELLIELLGSRGRHTRTAVGVAALPGDVAVEIDMVMRVRENVQSTRTEGDEIRMQHQDAT